MQPLTPHAGQDPRLATCVINNVYTEGAHRNSTSEYPGCLYTASMLKFVKETAGATLARYGYEAPTECALDSPLTPFT